MVRTGKMSLSGRTSAKNRNFGQNLRSKQRSSVTREKKISNLICRVREGNTFRRKDLPVTQELIHRGVLGHEIDWTHGYFPIANSAFRPPAKIALHENPIRDLSLFHLRVWVQDVEGFEVSLGDTRGTEHPVGAGRNGVKVKLLLCCIQQTDRGLYILSAILDLFQIDVSAWFVLQLAGYRELFARRLEREGLVSERPEQSPNIQKSGRRPMLYFFAFLSCFCHWRASGMDDRGFAVQRLDDDAREEFVCLD